MRIRHEKIAGILADLPSSTRSTPLLTGLVLCLSTTLASQVFLPLVWGGNVIQYHIILFVWYVAVVDLALMRVSISRAIQAGTTIKWSNITAAISLIGPFLIVVGVIASTTHRGIGPIQWIVTWMFLLVGATVGAVILEHYLCRWRLWTIDAPAIILEIFDRSAKDPGTVPWRRNYWYVGFLIWFGYLLINAYQMASPRLSTLWSIEQSLIVFLTLVAAVLTRPDAP